MSIVLPFLFAVSRRRRERSFSHTRNITHSFHRASFHTSNAHTTPYYVPINTDARNGKNNPSRRRKKKCPIAIRRRRRRTTRPSPNSFTILFIVSLAVSASCLVNLSCRFLVSGDAAVGLFYYYLPPSSPDGTTGDCIWHDDNFRFDDSNRLLSQTVAVVAVLVGGFVLFWIAIETLWCDFPCGQIIESVGLLIAGVCQGLTLMILKSDGLCVMLTLAGQTGESVVGASGAIELIRKFYKGDFEEDCELGLFGYVSMIAAGLFLVASVMTCVSLRPDPYCV